jgi:pyrroloquinoline quinone biosynthesis protein A
VQLDHPRHRDLLDLQVQIAVSLTEAAFVPQDSKLYHLEVTMWNKPEYTEMRFGFEVTMYIANR